MKSGDVKTMKENKTNSIVRFFAFAMLTLGLIMASAQMVLADTLSDYASDFVAMGGTAAFILFIVAIFIYALYSKSDQYGGMAKALAVVLVVIGIGIWAGVFYVSETGPDTGTLGVQPTWGVTVNACNNTTVGTSGVAAVTVAILWDISDDAITGCDDLTMNFTVYRDDVLSDYYYCNAYVDDDSLDLYTANEGTSNHVIGITGGNPQIVWTDSQSNALTNVWEMPTIPQAETMRETITIDFDWADTGIRGMVDETQSVTSFNIVFASESTNSAGEVISLTPVVIPVTLIVTTQA